MVILIAVGLCNIIARILLLKTVLIWRGVRVIDGAAGARSEGQGLVFFSSINGDALETHKKCLHALEVI